MFRDETTSFILSSKKSFLHKNTYFTNRSTRLPGNFSKRFKFEITRTITLTKTYKIRKWIVHNVTELSGNITLAPRFPVYTYIKRIFIDSTRQIVTRNRRITEPCQFLSPVPYQPSTVVGEEVRQAVLLSPSMAKRAFTSPSTICQSLVDISLNRTDVLPSTRGSA